MNGFRKNLKKFKNSDGTNNWIVNFFILLENLLKLFVVWRVLILKYDELVDWCSIDL